MIIEDVTKKIAEEYDNGVAKAFTYQIANLLKKNGIEVQLTRKEISSLMEEGKDFTKYIREYELEFSDVDTSEHDAKVRSDAIDSVLEILAEGCSLDEEDKAEMKNYVLHKMKENRMKGEGE